MEQACRSSPSSLLTIFTSWPLLIHQPRADMFAHSRLWHMKMGSVQRPSPRCGVLGEWSLRIRKGLTQREKDRRVWLQL